jgi:predicted dehydrogenase
VIEIGLVGCGNWGQHILKDFVELGCKVHVVAHSEESRKRAMAGGAVSVRNSLSEIPSVDGFVVATPTSTHTKILMEILARKTPVYVEKPLCTSSKEARELVRKGSGRLFVMDKWRYHPGIQALAGIVRSGELGMPLGLRTARIGWGERHSDTDVIWHLLPHDLSIGLEILGYIPKPSTAVVERVDRLAMSMTAVFSGGTWMVSEVSERSPERRRLVRLYCEKGVASLDGAYAKSIEIAYGTGLEAAETVKKESRPIPGDMPLRKELEAFVRHITGGGPAPKSSAEEGAQIVGIIEKLIALSGH